MDIVRIPNHRKNVIVTASLVKLSEFCIHHPASNITCIVLKIIFNILSEWKNALYFQDSDKEWDAALSYYISRYQNIVPLKMFNAIKDVWCKNGLLRRVITFSTGEKIEQQIFSTYKSVVAKFTAELRGITNYSAVFTPSRESAAVIRAAISARQTERRFEIARNDVAIFPNNGQHIGYLVYLSDGRRINHNGYFINNY